MMKQYNETGDSKYLDNIVMLPYADREEMEKGEYLEEVTEEQLERCFEALKSISATIKTYFPEKVFADSYAEFEQLSSIEKIGIMFRQVYKLGLKTVQMKHGKIKENECDYFTVQNMPYVAANIWHVVGGMMERYSEYKRKYSDNFNRGMRCLCKIALYRSMTDDNRGFSKHTIGITVSEEGDEIITLYDITAGNDNTEEEALFNATLDSMNDFDRGLCDMLLDGYSMKEISQHIGYTTQGTGKCFRRMRKYF